MFLHNWKKEDDVFADFGGVDPSGIKILFASYGTDNYEGAAWVLFEQDGKLFENDGSHCSCYGLEDQWEPKEIVLPELKNRILKGTFGTDGYSDNYFRPELAEFLGIKLIES